MPRHRSPRPPQTLLLLLLLVLRAYASHGAMISMETCDREPACTCQGPCRDSPPKCFGVSLPKGQVAARQLFASYAARLNTTDYLRAWEGVIGHVPQCWPRLQALLCTVAYPPCSVNGTVLRPAQEMCLHTLKACRILAELFHDLPRFLRCENYLPQDNCSLEQERLKSRATLNYHKFEKSNTSCRAPLVKTSYQKNWFRGIEGCGFRCQPPFFSAKEYRSARFLIPCMAFFCCCVNLFVCITFLLEWQAWSRYPRIIIFYIHCCFFFGCLGWLAQCVPTLYTDIVCRKDGSLRRAEPQLNSGESLTCSLVFALIYFTLLAVGSWLVLLLAAICPKLQTRPAEGGLASASEEGRTRRSWRHRRQRAPSRLVCHLLAWILPSVFTIICLTVGEIDGDPLAGICFVGHFSLGARVGLLLVPLSVSSIAGLLLLARILRLQWLLLARAREQNREAAACEGGVVPVALLRRARRSTGIFACGLAIIFAYACGIQVYLVINQSTWDRHFRRQIICEMRHQLEVSGAVSTLHSPLAPSGASCDSIERPSASLLLMHVAAYFAANLLLTSLSFDRRVLHTWRRFGGRLTSWCRQKLSGGYVSSPRSDTSLEPSSHSLVSPPSREPLGFSWWDLGFFPPRQRSRRAQEGSADAAPGPDSEGSELISSSRYDIAPGPKQQPGLIFPGQVLSSGNHQGEFTFGHRRSESFSSARTTPNNAGLEDGAVPAKRSHRTASRAPERRSRRPSQRRHERGDIRRSMSDCSSASSAAVQWRGSWGSVQSYNSYNPQRGVLEECYANWRVQAALNWSSSMAPFYSHTGLPLNFAWQTPVAIPTGHVASGAASPAALWCPHTLWPVYMLGPPMASHVAGQGKNAATSQHTNSFNAGPASRVPAAAPVANDIATGEKLPANGAIRRGGADGAEDSDAFDSEEEVESMNSDAFDSEEEVMSGSEEEGGRGEEEEGAEEEGDLEAKEKAEDVG